MRKLPEVAKLTDYYFSFRSRRCIVKDILVEQGRECVVFFSTYSKKRLYMTLIRAMQAILCQI